MRSVGPDHFTSPAPVFRRAVVGNMTADLQVDVVFMAGDLPVFYYSPGIHDAVIDFPDEVNEIAMMPGGGSGELDALLTTSARGLERWFHEGASSFSSELLGSSNWHDATRVHAVDLDQSGTMDAVGLMADQHTLRMLYNPLGSWSESTLYVSNTVYDFVVLNWTGTNSPELALLTDAGICVVRQAGSVAATFSVGEQGDPLAVMRIPGSSYERLVGALEDGSGGHQSLYVMKASGIEHVCALGVIDAVGVSVGDLNQDGGPDVLISHKSSHNLWQLTNLDAPDGACFSIEEEPDIQYIYGGTSGSPMNNGTVPAITDIDYDGDNDVVFPTQALAVLQVAAFLPAGEPGSLTISEDSSLYYDPSTQSGEVTVLFGEPEIALANANAVQYVVWRQPAVGQFMDPNAVAGGRVMLSANYPQTVTFPIEQGMYDPVVHWIEARLVRVQAGQIVAAGPSAVAATATNGDVCADIVEWYGGSAADLGLVTPPGIQLEIRPGIVPLATIPNFEDGEIPNLPP